ncbi:Helix-turn-helix domain-containing protein [Lentzea albidocapillata subsp. violacea]|uniref:Helix-turn-helix domain-containing protein n=1 Tax=Lentzea albidocapillata subsp. violacea TaxID=128104 RepID=A0A1G8UR19_9PSEU|nr:helix-turn-helix transcriptional regulator [Lentzea albidocapillata]SDJ56248.1 Helix-turn-helix domain-containing protein [Lentzea albidocapillata subsp. violacea]
MATSTPSTAYSRDLGDELRKVRETSSALTGAALAVRLGWDPSKVSTLENGKYRPSEIDLVQYLSMLGKDIDFFEDFKRRFRYAFEEYIVQVSDNLRTLAMAESTAIMITSYDPQAVPGLSQTPEYADSLYRMGGYIVEERIPTVVKFRMDRQVILNRHDRPTCLFYIHEHALQTQVGDAQTMEDQYAKLLFGAPTIRIVPATAKLVATSCVLWEYEKAMPVAFTSTDLAKVFVQDPGAIARTRLLFDRLAEVALDEEQSRKVLADYVGRPREELNERGPRLA